jgi:transcriptional regulator with XRE-family HTH domain
MGAAATLLYGPSVPLDAAAWVLQVREATGLSQERFAEHIDRSRSAIARWETGENEMDFESVRRIIAAFPEAAAMLAGTTDKRPSEPLLKNMETREIVQDLGSDPAHGRPGIASLLARLFRSRAPVALTVGRCRLPPRYAHPPNTRSSVGRPLHRLTARRRPPLSP